jgi:trk/ktr system potassium uptake protein
VNLAQVARILAGFTVFFTLAQAVPLAMAFWETDNPSPWVDARQGFVASFGVGIAVAFLLWLSGRKAKGPLFRKEGIAVAGLAWVLAGVLGAIPFQWSGLLPNPFDAVFETVSGLGTCGGTVLGSGGNPPPEAVCHSLLFWRALIQWIGGIGIVLVFVALLPAMGVTGKNLLSTESVSVASEGFQPRMLEHARTIVVVYLSLTLACTLLLVVPGGMTPFEATCHAFTALATGGYSTRSSIAEFHSLAVEVILTVFMFVAGCNFAVLATSVRHRFAGPGTLMRSSEFKSYLLFTLAMIALVAADLVRNGTAFGTSLRQSAFNTVSMITCCGYATADFQAWPPLSIIVLFTCMVIGGCTGSTAGGFKQVRFVVALKLMAYTLRHFVRPKSVERLKLDGEVLAAATVSSIMAIIMLWLLAILVGGIVLSCDSRLNFVGALSASASMLGCCGPAMTVVAHGEVLGPNIGPFGGYGDLHDWTKMAMSVEMILGRLELLTLLALFSPRFWRR